MTIVDLQNVNKLLYSNNKFGENSHFSYSSFYSSLKFKQDDVIDILNIGNQPYGFILLTHDYFINSNVVCDSNIFNDSSIDLSNFKRLKTNIIDLYDINNWVSLNGLKYYLIISNCNEEYDKILTLINNFKNITKPNAMLILENIANEMLDQLVI